MPVSLMIAMLAVTANFQVVLDEMRIAQDIPGVSAVVTQADEVLFAGASGVADLESGREMTADTELYAGSLTKIFTATLLLQLVDHGELSLDDIVTDIALDTSGPAGEITILQLLTHSSGLEREGNFGYWFSAEFPDDKALSRYLLNTKLRTRPGASVHYSNVGYAALGPIIRRASGMSYADALETRILEPLEMTSSGAPGPGLGIAVGYTPVGRLIPNEDRPFAGVGKPIAGRHVREYHDAGAMTPAFGAYTSARDMSRLARFILGYGARDLLSDDMRINMLTPRISGRAIGLRIGQLNGRRVARHDGWFAAHRSHFLLDLQAAISVVVLTNSDSAAPDQIAAGLLTAALKLQPDSQTQ